MADAAPRRIPELGDDGLRRLDCPACGKLLARFGKRLIGGPLEFRCKCGHEEQFWVNTVPS